MGLKEKIFNSSGSSDLTAQEALEKIRENIETVIEEMEEIDEKVAEDLSGNDSVEDMKKEITRLKKNWSRIKNKKRKIENFIAKIENFENNKQDQAVSHNLKLSKEALEKLENERGRMYNVIKDAEGRLESGKVQEAQEELIKLTRSDEAELEKLKEIIEEKWVSIPDQ